MAGVSYSQKGGFSANVGFLNYNQYGGFSFEPGMNVSYSKQLFYIGKRSSHHYLATASSEGNAYTIDAKLEYSNEWVNEAFDANFARRKELLNLYSDGSLPPDTETAHYYREGDKVYYVDKKTGEESEVWGVTVPVGRKKSDIYLFQGAFTSLGRFLGTLGHEYIHVLQYVMWGKPRDDQDLQWREAAAWAYLQEQAKVFDTRMIPIPPEYQIHIPPSYNYTRFINIITKFNAPKR